MVRNKWTDEEIEKVTSRLLAGESVIELAMHYNIHPRTMYQVMEKYGVKAPRYWDTNQSLSPSERYFAIRLAQHTQAPIQAFLPLPRYCAVSGVRMKYQKGFKTSAMPLKYRDTWYVVTQHVYDLVNTFTSKEMYEWLEWSAHKDVKEYFDS